MTREEAKKRLEVWLICANCPEDKMCYDSHLHSICEYTDYCDEVPIEEAVKVAIEALEQEPCEDKYIKEIDHLRKYIGKLETQIVGQQPCEDEYIKVPKKALKYRTAGMVAYNAEWLKKHFDLERAVICGEQEPCDDAISRQAVIDGINRYFHDEYYQRTSIQDCRDCLIEDVIKALPPVNPQESESRQFAKWVAEEIFDEENWEYNKDAFAEIACRKLAKLGIVRAKGDEWELIEPQERSGEE